MYPLDEFSKPIEIIFLVFVVSSGRVQSQHYEAEAMTSEGSRDHKFPADLLHQ